MNPKFERDHPTDLELAEWIGGLLRDTPAQGKLVRHVMACNQCAGLLIGQGDAAYELLRTYWRDLHPQEQP